MATPTLLQGLMNPQVVDAGGAIGQGLQNVQRIQQIGEAPMRNKLLGLQTQQAEQGLAQGQQEIEAAQRLAEAQSLMSGINAAERFIEAGDIEGLNTYLTGRESEISARGGDPRHTVGFKQQIMQGPAEGESEQDYLKRLKSELQQDKENLYSSGLIKRPEMSKADEEFLKGEINDVRSTTKDLKKRAGEIQTSFNKIEGLAGQMSPDGKLPRTAINAGIMSLARMISPGVVTEKDAAAIAGVSTPAQAIMEMFKRGLSQAKTPEEKARFERAQEDFIRSFDPANPETFNVDGFRAIAKTVAGAEAGTILQQWDEAKNRLERSGAGKNVMETNFGGKNESIIGLSAFLEESESGVSEELTPAQKLQQAKQRAGL